MDEDSLPTNFVESIVAHTATPHLDADIGGTPLIVAPDNWRVHDQSALLQRPARPKGFAVLHDTASFCAYLKAQKEHRVPEGPAATLYCDANLDTGAVTFKAMFNDRMGDVAGWGDFGAMYTLPQSVEWKRWVAHDRKPLEQAAFATFIEDNLRDIAGTGIGGEDASPSGSEMLQMALALEINNDNSVKSAVRLQSGGVELTYVNREDEGTLRKMQVFERFAIGIPAFLRGKAYRIQARLRYRAGGGKITFWYELIRLDLVVADAVNDTATAITEATGLACWYGKP